MTSPFDNGRTGLAVMDIQVLHDGHYRLLNRLRATCSRGIVGLGSVRKYGTPGHPFDSEQRRAMIDGLFGPGAFAIVLLDDIDTSVDEPAWGEYVIAKCRASGLPRPTDYFAGSRSDAAWYVHAFAPLTGEGYVTADCVVYEGLSDRRLHVVEREGGGIPSGRVLRDWIERREPDWRRFVPERLHAWIEANYPGHLRRPLAGKKFPDPSAHPTGTRFVLHAEPDPVLHDLKDDGVWRPLKAGPDEKTLHAVRAREAWEPNGGLIMTTANIQVTATATLKIAESEVRLHCDKFGLLMVDLVDGFCTPGHGPLAPPHTDARIEKMIGEVEALAHRIPKRFVFRDSHPDGQAEPPYPPHCVRGSGDDLLVKPLRWLEDEPHPATVVMPKDCINGVIGAIGPGGYNAVFDWIERNHIEHLVVVGICTDICVLNAVTALLSARTRGLARPLRNVIIYEPGCATYDLPIEAVHALGLPETAAHPRDFFHNAALMMMANQGAVIAKELL